MMNAPEFLVEFTRAYGEILIHLWWPLAVLIIFFVLLFYFDRTLGAFSRKRRFPLSWKEMNRLVVQMERRLISENQTNPLGSHQRLLLVQEQIQKAKQAIERRNEQELMRSLFTLSSLGIYSDHELSQARHLGIEIDDDKGENSSPRS